MKIFDRDVYRRNRRNHGVWVSFTNTIDPVWWFAGWTVIGVIGGFTAAALAHHVA